MSRQISYDKFHLQHEISQAVDSATRCYIDVTPVEERTDRGVGDAMRSAAKEKTSKLL